MCRRGGEIDCGARVVTINLEVLVRVKHRRMERNIGNHLGKTPLQKERGMEILTVGMCQGECERVKGHGHALSIVGVDRTDRCSIECAFGFREFCCV